MGQEDPLEEEMATHASILAWRILWAEEAGGLQSMGLQKTGHDLATEQHYQLRAAWEPEREIPQFPIGVNQGACAETYIPLPETQTHE